MMSQKYNFSTIDNPISSKKGVFLTRQSKNKEAPHRSEASCKTATQANKRDSVPLAGRLSFLSACGRPQAQAPYPETTDEQPVQGPKASLPLYLDLQPIRFAPAECRHPPRELLPHVFTRTLAGGIFFCGTVCYTCVYLPVKKYGALCCPDFPRAGFPGPRQSA